MITVSDTISLRDEELHFAFIRSPGPGGQNVNKVSTAVQLRFNVRYSPSLTPDIKARLIDRAGNRMTKKGELIVTARRFRTQEANRADAIRKLIQLIAQSEKKPLPRIKTTPTTSSKLNRILEKDARKETKRMRRPVHPADEA